MANPHLHSLPNPLADAGFTPASYEGTYKGYKIVLTKDTNTFSYWVATAYKKGKEVASAGFDGGFRNALGMLTHMLDNPHPGERDA